MEATQALLRQQKPAANALCLLPHTPQTTEQRTSTPTNSSKAAAEAASHAIDNTEPPL
jgi:hypothetical protein